MGVRMTPRKRNGIFRTLQLWPIMTTSWLTRLRRSTLERGNTARTWRFRPPSSSINTVSSAPSSAPRVSPGACRPREVLAIVDNEWASNR